MEPQIIQNIARMGYLPNFAILFLFSISSFWYGFYLKNENEKFLFYLKYKENMCGSWFASQFCLTVCISYWLCFVLFLLQIAVCAISYAFSTISNVSASIQNIQTFFHLRYGKQTYQHFHQYDFPWTISFSPLDSDLDSHLDSDLDSDLDSNLNSALDSALDSDLDSGGDSVSNVRCGPGWIPQLGGVSTGEEPRSVSLLRNRTTKQI